MRTKLERKTVLALLLAAVTSAAVACSSLRLKKHRSLWDLDFEQRALFISYYPFLDAVQRRNFIARIDEAQDLVRDWQLPEGLQRDPKNYTLKELEIQGTAPDRHGGGGGSVTFKALLHYASGKTVNVTHEVAWSATPGNLVKMRDNVLDYGCLKTDVVVSADFYSLKQGSTTLDLGQKIASLRLEKSEAAPAVDVADDLQLKLVATCSDGTWSDVSCQATWQTHERFGRFSACGVLQLARRTSDLDEKVHVSATYGGITIQQQFTPLMYPRIDR